MIKLLVEEITLENGKKEYKVLTLSENNDRKILKTYAKKMNAVKFGFKLEEKEEGLKWIGVWTTEELELELSKEVLIEEDVKEIECELVLAKVGEKIKLTSNGTLNGTIAKVKIVSNKLKCYIVTIEGLNYTIPFDKAVLLKKEVM